MGKRTEPETAPDAPTSTDAPNEVPPSGDAPASSDAPGPTVTESATDAPKLLAPLEWARKHKKISKASPLKINGKPRGERPTWDHAAADQLHGWTAHSTHSAEPFVLSEADYLAALAAAAKPIAATEGARLKYLPHPAALSPFAPRGR